MRRRGSRCHLAIRGPVVRPPSTTPLFGAVVRPPVRDHRLAGAPAGRERRDQQVGAGRAGQPAADAGHCRHAAARDAGWAYEMKWDGIRALAFVAATARSGWCRAPAGTSATCTPSLRAWPPRWAAEQAVLDGEIVAFGDSDWPDFEALQQRMNISSAAQARAAGDPGAGQLPGVRPALARRQGR